MFTANFVVTIEDGRERPRLIRDEDELDRIVSSYWGGAT
jgi:amide synthase